MNTVVENLGALFRSLRFRLTLWNTAVVVVTVLVALWSVREGLRLTLLREMDQLLLDDTTEVALVIEQSYPDLKPVLSDMQRKATGHSDRGLCLQLVDADGDSLWKSENMPKFDGHTLPRSSRATFADVGGFRIAQQGVHAKNSPAFIIRAGAPLSLIEDDVAKVTRIIASAGMVTLLISPLGGYWLAGRATRPIARIISTASRLRPSHMDERLPIRGTGDELDKLSRTINSFLDLIAEYLDRNREFVANAAHELRSPLAAIQSSVEVSLNVQRSPAEYQDLLDEIADQCGDLGVLVNQLLLLAETDSSQTELDRRALSLDRLIEKSIDMFRGAAEERGIALTFHPSPMTIVEADGDRLRQVFNNLIDNSLKFTPRGGKIQILLERLPHERVARVSVSDTGPGIPPEDLARVFERFFRGDKSRQRDNTRGNGLGLSICHSIIAAHGGTISVESKLGSGTKFVVTLPATASLEAGSHETARLGLAN